MESSKVKFVFKRYIVNNYKEYLLVSLLFIIGLFIGVFIINNLSYSQFNEISTYIGDFISEFQKMKDLNNTELFIISIKNNIVLALLLWIAGTTVIGLPIVLIIIFFRGIIFGYTISSFVAYLGCIKGLAFCLASIFFQNILFIPAILTLGVSSIKLYKAIIKDKRKENIKLEIFRHFIISLLMIIVIIISSLIENFISISILKKIIKYF